MPERVFTWQSVRGKLWLLRDGKTIGAALRDRHGYWDAEISDRLVGRFPSLDAAERALWAHRALAARRNWRGSPYFEL